MAEQSSKNYPSATSEVAKLFNITPDDSKAKAAAHPVADLPVADLPVAEAHVVRQDPHASAESNPAQKRDTLLDKLQDMDHMSGNPAEVAQRMKLTSLIRLVFPYVVIFAAGILVYFFFFSNFDFGSLFKNMTVRTSVTPKQTALQQLEKQSLPAYNQWISSFYYDVSDPKVLDPDADNSGNGLSNFQKYLLNLNPKSYSTLGFGAADSELLAQGTNPLTGNKLTDTQQQIIKKYFDMEVIMNRLALDKLQKNGSVAGMSTSTVATATNISNIVNYRSFESTGIRGAQDASAAVIQDPEILNASNLQIDTSKPGRLEIPSLGVNAPIMWSSDPKNFETDLKSGVIHYPGTAMPGQIGTSYISGHSSNYAWVKGNYNHVFTHLGDISNDQSFKITVVQTNGKDAILHYAVTDSKQYSPTDPAQFNNAGKSVVALSTCWPVGSTSKRLVVFGELTQVEQ